MEVWEREEFQPVLAFLSSLREEAVDGLRTLNLTQNAEQVKTIGAILKTQYNMANMIYELPAYVKEVEAQLAKDEETKARMARSQERGSI